MSLKRRLKRRMDSPTDHVILRELVLRLGESIFEAFQTTVEDWDTTDLVMVVDHRRGSSEVPLEAFLRVDFIEKDEIPVEIKELFKEPAAEGAVWVLALGPQNGVFTTQLNKPPAPTEEEV